MTAYFIRRLLLIVPTVIGVTVIAFAITRMVSGGPLERAILQMRMAGAGGEGGGGVSSVTDPTAEMSSEALAQLRANFDLDKPDYVAYVLWLKKVAMLDLGISYTKREPVARLIAQRLPVSITFGLTGFVLAYVVSIPLGIVKALRHGSLLPPIP